MRYEFVRAKLDKNNYAMNADMESHREVIDRMAAEGKRYAGWFPVTQGPTGKTMAGIDQEAEATRFGIVPCYNPTERCERVALG